MVSLTISLNSINAVKDFVTLANLHDFEINLKLGKYIVDGKSIMGIFGLDLSKNLILEAACDAGNEFIKQLEPFIVG